MKQHLQNIQKSVNPQQNAENSKCCMFVCPKPQHQSMTLASSSKTWHFFRKSNKKTHQKPFFFQRISKKHGSTESNLLSPVQTNQKKVCGNGRTSVHGTLFSIFTWHMKRSKNGATDDN